MLEHLRRGGCEQVILLKSIIILHTLYGIQIKGAKKKIDHVMNGLHLFLILHFTKIKYGNFT